MNTPSRPVAVTAISLFFFFGTLMSGLAALLLLFPGSRLDALWRVNPRGHEGFAAMGGWAIVLMLTVCAACLVAAVGLWRCRRWGAFIAIAILGINILGDTVNAVVAHDRRTLIGLPIGGAMIIYLLHFLGRDRIPGPADRN